MRGQERGSHVAIFREDPTCLTPRKLVLHSLYQVPTFLGMLMVSISKNTKVKKGRNVDTEAHKKTKKEKKRKQGKRR